MTNSAKDVDDYLTATLVGADAALTGVLRANAEAGLPAIDVSPPQGKLLYLLAKSIGAKRILEVGTLGGYSTVWLARSGAHVVTLELSAEHAAVARANLEAAGVGDRVEVRVGPALETLLTVEADAAEPFDFVFVDADKVNNANYVRAALKLTRPGAIIVVDNVIRGGNVADPEGDAAVQGSREVLELIASSPRLDGTAIQTDGSKGWDGFAIAIVTE
mgnify:CR=1 FL=1